MMYGKQQFYIDDETIALQLKQKPYANANGKRYVLTALIER